MFYEIVNALCKERKTTITRMAEDIGLSNAAPTSWRKGAIPKLSTLEKVSKYFGVSTNYLLGKEDNEKTAIQTDDGANEKKLTPEGERDYSDADLIEAFNKADATTREAIRLLLKLQ